MTGQMAADLAEHAARLLAGTGTDLPAAMRMASGEGNGEGLLVVALRDGWKADETRQGEQ